MIIGSSKAKTMVLYYAQYKVRTQCPSSLERVLA